MDAASDRVRLETDARFRDLVEGSRMGYVFAHDLNAYVTWRRRHGHDRRPTRAPSDEMIMGQIAQLAAMFPGQVVYGTMP